MKQRTPLLLAIQLLTSVALGQSPLTVSGVVSESGSGKPLENARVTVVGGGVNDAVTDSDGTFILTFPGDVKIGSAVRIHIDKPDYGSFTKTIAVSPTIPVVVTLERVKRIPGTAARSAQTPSPKIDSGPTGFLQIETFEFAEGYSTLLANRQIALNFPYKNPGPYPVSDRHTFEAIFLLERSDSPSGEGFKRGEREIIEDFEGARNEQYARTVHIPTVPVGKDSTFYKSVIIPDPLTETQVSKILDGSLRIYALAWATWKDSRAKVGTLTVCYWLQPPKSTDLLAPPLVWHDCTEPF
jgi:hypothetical protein